MRSFALLAAILACAMRLEAAASTMASDTAQATPGDQEPRPENQEQEPPRKKDDSSRPPHPQEPAAPAPGSEGVVPKSIRIPGTDLFLRIGGYVKVDFIQDFDAVGDPFEFKTNGIPVEGTSAAAESGQTTIHARESRVNLDLRSQENGKLRIFVEGDFFGDKNAFRLRHAYGQFRGLLGGQTWSTFQDISSRPLTIDFEGPDGEVFVRQAMIRYTRALTPKWTWAIAAESPTPQLAVPSGLAGSVRSDAPDLPGYVRYQAERGHFQLAGIVRQIRFDGGEGVPDSTAAGWGVNATFVLKTRGHDELHGGFVTGDGVARYIEALSGQNVDAVLDADGELTTLRSRAVMLGYTRHWSGRLRSGVAYSVSDVKSDPTETPTVIDRTRDFRANLIWTPYPLFEVGGELLWGRRENLDGSRGDAWRFQFAMIYHLN